MWKPWGQLFLLLKTEVLPPDAQSCHSWPGILRWRLDWPSMGKNSLATRVRWTIPRELSKYSLLSVSRNFDFLFLFKHQISLWALLPSNGQSTCGKTLSTSKKNRLGVLWRERILLTFSVTFLLGITLADIFSFVAEILQRVGFMWEPRFTAGCVST